MKTVLPLLSERMKQVLNMVSECQTAADIGCDHGYVAIRLIESGRARRVIASDINEGPLVRAKEHIREFGLEDRIETRISDGFSAYAAGEAQSAVLAGMGGRLMCSILEKGLLCAREMQEIILQPQSQMSFVRAWLREHGFAIAGEDMVSEDGKFYPMMRVIPQKLCAAHEADADGEDLQRIQDRYGPCLLAARHPVLIQYLCKERKTCEAILCSLSGSTQGQRERRDEMNRRMRDILLAEKILGADSLRDVE